MKALDGVDSKKIGVIDYNAKRLSTFLSNAKVGAMALIVAVGMASCGTNASTEVKTDSTNVDSAKTTQVDSTTVKADTAAVTK